MSLTRAERLDALPFAGEHRRLLLGSGIGWALDAMDVGLVSFVLAALAVEWGTGPTELSWIAAAGSIGMAVGAALGGLLADRIGRRQVFALTLLVYGLATGAAALATSVGVLIALRVVIGLGLGAELPVASTLVAEFAPARIRGRVVVVLEAFWAVGWLAAAVIGYLVVGPNEGGWRWAFVIGAVPALYAVVVRRALPESVRFLESRGRTAEAEAAVRRFEAAAGVPAPAGAPERSAAPPGPVVRVGPGALWRPALRRRTAALWLVWFGISFGYYGAFIWLPTLLLEQGFTLVRSFGFTLVITLAQLPGYAVAALLVERWGRRATLVTFLAGSAAAAGAFGLAGSEGAVLVTGCLLSFFALGAWGAVYATTPEVYPTPVRATGAGSAAAFGRTGAILAQFSVPPLLALGGSALVFAAFGAAFVLAAVAALAVPEQRGAPLEAVPAPAPVLAPAG